MLIVTNRTLADRPDAAAFGRGFVPGATRLGFANVRAGAEARWRVDGVVPDASDTALEQALVTLFQGPRPLLVYLHGNNNTPSACFERCALLASLYDLQVVGFSWPSEGWLADGANLPLADESPDVGDENSLRAVRRGNRTDGAIRDKIRRYHQAMTNARDSIDAVARFLSLLARARARAGHQPHTIAAHSLGAFLLQYSLGVTGAEAAVAEAQNVALLAACVRAAGHREWLGLLRPKGQVLVTFNASDSVLFGAAIADGGTQQTKLGAEPGPLLQSPGVRYVSFTSAEVGLGGHAYFAREGMPHKMKIFFDRTFGSQRDIQANEHPRAVYPQGCDGDGLTCYMAAPLRPDSQ